MSTPYEVLAQSRRLLKQLRSPPSSPESPPYPYPPCSYACDTAKSLGVALAAAGLAMVLYILIRLISNCLRRCDQPLEAGGGGGGGAAPSPKARDLSFIPTKVVSDDRELAPRQDCAICLARFSDGETIRVLPRCKHAFHRECLDPWLLSRCMASSLCPVCREPVTELWNNRQANMERPRDGGLSAVASTSILAQ